MHPRGRKTKSIKKPEHELELFSKPFIRQVLQN